MSNRYCNLTPSKQIKDDFGNITIGFDAVQNEMDGRITTDQSLQSQITAHINAAVAHTAQQIADSVPGLSSTNVHALFVELLAKVNTIIAGSSPDKDPELTDIKNLAPGYTPYSTISSPGDVVRDIEKRLIAATWQTFAAKYGWNYLLTDQASPLDYVIRGVTRVNLLGKIGNFETDSNSDGVADGWTGFQGIFTMSTSNVVYGAKAQRIQAKVEDSNESRYMTPVINIQAGKYYLFLVDFINDGSQLGRMYFEGAEMQSPSSKVMYAKANPDSDKQAELYLYNFGVVGTTGWVQYDGARLFEVDAATYAKIDVDPAYTGDNLAAKFPYVDGVKHTYGVGLMLPGQNLIPPFYDWSLHANADVTEPYEIVFNPTAIPQVSTVVVPCLPSQGYAHSIVQDSDMTFIIEFLDAKGQVIAGSSAFNGSGSRSFTTPLNCVFMNVKLYNNATGSFAISEPMLVLGDTSTLPPSFVPRNDDYAYVPITLADGDIFDSRIGTVTRLNKTGVVLDGSLSWGFDTDFAGYKGIYAPLSGGVTSTQVAERYDSKILQNVSTYSGGDQINYNGSFIYLSIWDTDSGWVESINPNTNAIDAIMNGWKANANDGSTYTSWESILDGSAPATNTEAWVAANKATGWTGWGTLSYKLAKAEPETVVPEGSLSSHNGGNQIEVLSGIVVREKVTPQTYGGATLYYINDTGLPAGQLARRTNKIIGIYRDGKLDKKWTIISGSPAYGNQRATIPLADFDTTAEYTVTYQALDRYLLTTNPVDLTLYYNTNPKTVLDSLVRNLSDAETQVSIHDRILADHTARLLALEA